MTDFTITTAVTNPLGLRSIDNALIAPSGLIATSGTAVTMSGELGATPALTVLGTLWTGGTFPTVRANGPAAITVGADGSITGGRGAAIIASAPAADGPASFWLLNEGTITARSLGISANNINLDLDNTGTIHSSGDAAIDAVGFAHRIVNDGVISGLYGIKANAESVTHIVNTGHISGTAPIIVYGAHAVIENRGTLTGNVTMLTDSGVFDGRGGGGATVYSGDGAHLLRGGSGDDLLSGGGGADELRGGAGEDVLRGGEGDDLILGGEGDDRLEGGADADDLRGGEGDDSMSGDGGSDLLIGGAGDDTLTGWTENDTLDGGAGNDLIDGGAGVDTLVFRSASAVTVDLRLTDAQATGQGLDTILSVENLIAGAGADRLTGSAGANRLWGGLGNDTLAGGDGNDWLTGGAGNDRLNGGNGKDVFVFRTASGRDVIDDFQNGLDRINLRGLAEGIDDMMVSQSGANTVLAAGEVRITLAGVSAGLIDATDFIF